MKNRNAFTMIEMLGVIVILALISVFSIPVINTLSNQSKQNRYSNFLKILNNAADTYIEQNFEKYNNTNVQYIYVKKLVENGYISDTLINPKTNEEVINENGMIIVTKNIDKTMSYEYSLNEQVIIYYIEDLVNLSKNVESGNNYQNKIVILTRNLDFNDSLSYKDSTATTYGDINGDGNNNTILVELTTLSGFKPIGNTSTPFKGTFVGDGNVISNLHINRSSESEIGLFGVIDGAKINGFSLDGNVNGGNNTGLLAGKAINNSEIIDMTTNLKTNSLTNSLSNIGGTIGLASNVILTNITSNPSINTLATNVGGIVGNMDNSTATYLKIDGMIDSDGSNIGGAFGSISSSIINNIETSGRFSGNVGTGGIAGNISNSNNIDNSTNRASISSSSKAGGLFGIVSNSTIKSCYNIGDINGTQYAGGLFGEINGSTVEINYSTGLVSGNEYIGGLVGSMNNSTINNNYNWGDVGGTSSVGGVAGIITSSNINRTYSVGNISGETNIGGLVGKATNSSNVNFSYYNSDRTNQNVVVGDSTGSNSDSSKSLVETEMKNQTSFVSWDFSNIWKVDSGLYPTFKSEIGSVDQNQYVLTIDPNGGVWNLSSEIVTSNVMTGEILNIAYPAKRGVLFVGWTLTGIDSNITNTTFVMGKSDTTLVANWVAVKEEFAYTGEVQEFVVPADGWYQVELWGAQGGTTPTNYSGGKGAYTRGKIYLNENETFNIYVGGAGMTGSAAVIATYNGGWNGGGKGYVSRNSCNQTAASGGGATDLRYGNDTLNSRIMVASGGGGAYTEYCSTTDNANIFGGAGGGLIGSTALYSSYAGYSKYNPTGGTQMFGGQSLDAWTSTVYGTTYSGTFGQGATGGASYGGGGGGYYGGASGGWQPGAGGSSFISGYAGVNAIESSTSLTPTNNTIHYSGKYFIDGEMQSGVNEGNGKAKITYLSEIKPEKVNTKLNNVRYVKDCVNGNSVNSNNQWMEIQAIYQGTNIALSSSITGSSAVGTVNADTYNVIINGDALTLIETPNIANSSANGLQCVTVDLGTTYDLDEIAIWHYWGDGRTYYDNITYVSSDNINWIEVINTGDISETSEGKRVNAYDNHFDYAYTGSEQEFIAPLNGWYQVELWGAQGGDANATYTGGKGAYTSGKIQLAKNTKLYVYVGQKSYIGGYNGGGAGGTGDSNWGAGGGGSTDIRFFEDITPTTNELTWNSTLGFNSRIMVAAAGGGGANRGDGYGDGKGGAGGGLIGYAGEFLNYTTGYGNCSTSGGTQISGGEVLFANNYRDASKGVFGAGGMYNFTGKVPTGGGGGYYGGGGYAHAGGSGGSSFISGHTGCVAITSSSVQTPKSGCTTGTTDNNCSIHYSNKVFTETFMIDGSGYVWTNVKGAQQQMPNPNGGYYALGAGHTGNGFAKITYLGEN